MSTDGETEKPPKSIHEKVFGEGAITQVVPFSDVYGDHAGLYQVKFRHDGQDFEYIWRPRVLERMISGAVERRSYYKREILFYVIANSLGIQAVPYACHFKLNGYVGSIQEQIPEVKKLEHHEVLKFIREYDKKEINKLVFLDYICGNLDRHIGNVIISRDKLWLIDNGLTFTTQFGHRRFSNPPEQLIRRHYSKDHMVSVVKEFEPMIDNQKFERAKELIKKSLGVASLDHFQARLDKALSLGRDR